MWIIIKVIVGVRATATHSVVKIPYFPTPVPYWLDICRRYAIYGIINICRNVHRASFISCYIVHNF
jgi:hypothetical protein